MRRRLTTLSVAIAVALAVLPPTAAAAEPAARPAVAPVTKVITLITGDQVLVTGERIEVRPGEGRDQVDFLHQPGAADISVVPSDAAPLLASGRLDRRLFNVSELLRQGFAGVEALPLIVTGQRPTLASIGAITAKASPDMWASVLSGDAKVWLDGRARLVLDQSVPQIGAPAA